MSLVNANGDAGITTDLFVIGKKGVNYLSFLGRDLARTYPDLPDAPEFAEVEVIASGFMKD